MKLNIKIDEKELAYVLNLWFNHTNKSDKHFWKRNKVARIIKEQLKELKHWKNLGNRLR